MRTRTATGSLFALAMAAPLLAHGGQYRGPWNAPPGAPAPGPGGPAAPRGPVTGPGTPLAPAPGPSTGGRPAIADGTSWQVWWEFAKDPLIGAAPPNRGPTTGSDEFFLGARRPSGTGSAEAITAVDRRERIAAALLRALRGTPGRDLRTATLIALAKVGEDPPGARLVDVFVGGLADGDQEVRETATLALGIAGRAEALDVLAALLEGKAAGRRLAGKNEAVPDRTRTFAAWALGLLAGRSKDLAAKLRAHDLLLAALLAKDEPSRDLRVGAIQALGLLVAPAERDGPAKRLVWQTVGELWDYYQQDLGKGDQLVQAHVPAAVVHLLGRGTSAEHQRAKQLLAGELTNARKRGPTIQQSAAIALGQLCSSAEEFAEDAPFSRALAQHYDKGADQLARFQAALALGRIGGDGNRRALLAAYPAASRAIERPWVALALGLLARQRTQRNGGIVDRELGKILSDDFQASDTDEQQAAFGLALGLCGETDAAPAIERRFAQGGRSDVREGYLAIAMALLDHVAAKDLLRDRMESSVRRPFVLQQCAAALGRLGDADAVPRLLALLDECESAATLAAIANGLGQIGDRRSLDPLIEIALDGKRTTLARAFAAAALGSIGDKEPLPWNARIAADTNYMAIVDTLTNGMTGVLDIL